MSRVFIYTELGTERLCSTCGEFYPFDEEFFNKNGIRNGRQQWTSKCKACFSELYRGAAA